MKSLIFALLLCATFAVAQDSNSTAPAGDNPKHDKSSITIQGCVSRSSGDYVLIKQDPAVTYELQATGKIKLRRYLGQRVEISGEQGPSLSTSSDAINRLGSASGVTISVSSIKMIDKECSAR
jgi:hypothetical protein